RDALDRGLRYNLGLTISGQGADLARAARFKALADLMPNVFFRGGETLERVNLSVFGIPLPAGTPNVVGPFSLFDARAVASGNLLDLNLLHKLRASDEQVKAAQLDYRNMRDVVVLAVGGAYLQVLTDTARVEAAQAQVKTGQRLYQQATDMKSAGVAPGIDVLRAQVEYQIQQQRVVGAQNDLDKHKLALGRIIGLSPSQQFTLSDTVPYAPAPPLTLDDAIARALRDRSDYQRAQRLLAAAQLDKKAAQEERLPTVQLSGDYGVLGKTPGSAERTYTGTVSLHVPIFQGGKVRGDVLQADTILRQRQSELEDLKARIEVEVRTAFLDLSSSAQQVEVARSSMDLAQQTLVQAQDRFAAGVTTNLEVVQAQESIAATNENYIATLFAFNYAKLSLARALGVAEDATKKYLGGNP
ncbi:MAG TPA: TolC family protein, partial [Ramlibacter sp.]|nr:TolC family protein [Ramlibacter sp.]